MPISCEECRQNLGQLVPPQGLPPQGLSTPGTDRDTRANDAPEAAQETLETPTTSAAPLTQADSAQANLAQANLAQANLAAQTVERFEIQVPEAQVPIVEALEVEAHVAGCQACSRELMRLRRMVGALVDLPVLPAPVDLRARIRSQLQAESVSTHAAATSNAQEKAASPRIINAPGFGDPEKPQSVSNAPRLKSDLARGWSRFWTRALRHPAQATWAGGAVLCALAFVVASRTPTLLSPAVVSTAANVRHSSPPTAKVPAPKVASQKPGRSATRNGASQKPPMGAASSARSNIAAQNRSASGAPKSNPRRPETAPSASDANSANSSSSSAVSPPTDSDESFRAPSTSAPSNERRNAKLPGAAQSVAGMSTHAAAQKPNAARGKAQQLQIDAPVALSLPKDQRQNAANRAQRVAPQGETRAASSVPRLARLELLPLETTPQAPPTSDAGAPGGRSIKRSGSTSSDADNARLLPRQTARREQEADEEAAPARRIRAPGASLRAPSIAAPSTASSAAATRNGVVAQAGREESLAAKADASAPDAIADAPATPNSSARDAPAGAASMAKGSAVAREEETAEKKLTPPISHRTDSANYIDNKLLATANRSRRARLRITPGRDVPKARVRVVLSGLAWSDASGASDSQPRIVWQGQARRGREIEVSRSLLSARASRDGRLRVELQGAKGEAWETLQTQDIPVAFP